MAMTIKTLLFVASGGGSAIAGLDWAHELARQQAAHLVIAWVGEAAEQSIPERFDLSAKSVTLLRHAMLDEAWLARQARHADLAVIALPQTKPADRGEDIKLIERLARHVGCPILTLPPHIVPGRVARRVAIAWDASPPAQRAVRAALPLLAKADVVAIVTIDPERPIDLATPLQHYLERHAIAATAEPIVGRDAECGALIEQAMDQLDADLLVMGACSRPRVAEWLLGQTACHVLGRLGIPIMVSA
jgi:nucleotide-binding universal stress UspA family protein